MNAEQRNVVIRYSAPSKFCLLPYGHIWKQMHDNDEFSLFVQTSPKEDEPQWVTMGSFLEKSFASQLLQESFIADCLPLFHK